MAVEEAEISRNRANEIKKWLKENSQLKDKIKATNQIIKEFLDLFHEGKIEINFPEFGIGVSTVKGSYDFNVEILKEIVDMYAYRVKHKEMLF